MCFLQNCTEKQQKNALNKPVKRTLNRHFQCPTKMLKFFSCDCNPLQSFLRALGLCHRMVVQPTHSLYTHLGEFFVNQILLLNFDGGLKHLQICMFDSNLPTARSNSTLDVKVENVHFRKSTSSNLKKTQLISLRQSFKNSTLNGICLNMGTIDIYGPKQQYIF